MKASFKTWWESHGVVGVVARAVARDGRARRMAMASPSTDDVVGTRRPRSGPRSTTCSRARVAGRSATCGAGGRDADFKARRLRSIRTPSPSPGRSVPVYGSDAEAGRSGRCGVSTSASPSITRWASPPTTARRRQGVNDLVATARTSAPFLQSANPTCRSRWWRFVKHTS